MAVQLNASDFVGGPGYLNTPSMGMPPRPAREELARVTELWQAGRIQAPEFDSWVERARSAFGRINSVDPATVAIGANVSSFVGLVAGSLAPGARVVGYRGDFASVLFPFMARGDLDVQLVELEDVADAVDAGTALAAVSAVQSSDGRLAALDDIAATGVRMLVDTTQSTGWLALDASRFDYTVCGAYKWLLSPRGTAFMTVRPERTDELIRGRRGLVRGRAPVAVGVRAGDGAGGERAALRPVAGVALVGGHRARAGVPGATRHRRRACPRRGPGGRAVRAPGHAARGIGHRVPGPPRRRRAAGRGGHQRGGARGAGPAGLPPVQADD